MLPVAAASEWFDVQQRRVRRCPRRHVSIRVTPREHRRLLRHPLARDLSFKGLEVVCVPRRHVREIRRFLAAIEPALYDERDRDRDRYDEREEQLVKPEPTVVVPVVKEEPFSGPFSPILRPRVREMEVHGQSATRMWPMVQLYLDACSYMVDLG
jgi:hypothetical protein